MEKTLLKILGTRIRETRKLNGLTQEALALKANMDRSYIGSVERGDRNLTFLMLCQICAALNCDVAFLASNLPEK